jgi:hypothetical protein
MARTAEGWSLCLSLPSGRYSYLLVIDGDSRQLDPSALLWEDNGFGTRNSVLIVD